MRQSLRIGLFSLMVFSSLNWPRQTIAASTIRLLTPDQVDCNNPPAVSPAVRDVVRSSQGVQTVTQYCRQTTAAIRSPLEWHNSDWGQPYYLNNAICRDHHDGIDTVCVTPPSADRLRWNPD